MSAKDASLDLGLCSFSSLSRSSSILWSRVLRDLDWLLDSLHKSWSWQETDSIL